MRQVWLALLMLLWSSTLIENSGANDYPAGSVKSGYEYLSSDSKALQDDEFANPGYLWVDKGRELWETPAGESGKSCASCHGAQGEVAMGGAAINTAATRYPRYERELDGLINLEQKINASRRQHQMAPMFEWESEDLLAITAFVANLARGKPLQVGIDGQARRYFEAGRHYFQTRRGQLNLACMHCHDQNAGRKLRGDTISQGHPNGFPAYRLQWQKVGSLHRRLRNCNEGVRAQQLAYGSDEYLSLELFLAWRARGLMVETPAVRP